MGISLTTRDAQLSYMIVRALDYPHLDVPHDVHIKHPSWYISVSLPHLGHFCPFASKPLGKYFFKARSTPIFQVLTGC